MSREHLLKKPVKNTFHRSLLLCLLSFFVFSLVSLYYGSEVYAGQATLSWVAPSINEDGTPLTDLAGYKIYYGTASGNYTQNVDAGNVTTYAFTNLTDGKTFYFVATAYNAAKFESKYSNEISKTIPALTQTYILSVNKAGTGSGMVTSSPAGISCGSDCTEVYTAGTVVTLTAVPDSSSSFGGWSGACSGTGTCSVTMNGAKNVKATFTHKTYAIPASAGNGGSISPSGTVTVNYSGSQSFTITPNANYTVGNVVVDGSNAGSVTSYNFANVTANHTISVSFTQNDDTNISVTNIPKTGQTMTHAMGDDGNVQAGVEWPAQRFTDNGDGTVTDNLTGLMWLKDGGCFKNSRGSALNTIAGLNNHTGRNTCLGYTADYTDWRLPTANELKSLVNYGTPDSAQWLNSEGFANMKSAYYWSATTYPWNAAKAWMVSMYNGTEKLGAKNNVYMLPVRIATSVNASKSGRAVIYTPTDGSYINEKVEWPAPRFTDNGDGTVTDSLTGLMWLKDGGCLKKRWSDTLNIIVDFNSNSLSYSCLGYTANYTDWRMPNVKELESMINYDVSDSAGWLNSAGFTNVKYSSYWSSTTSQKSAAQAWMINMQKSAKLLQNKKSNYYAWPVRGGNVDGN